MRRHPSIVIETGRLEGCSVRRQWGGRRSRTPDAPVVDVAVTNPATLRAVVEGAPLALCGFDQRGLISLWNPACAALFGWSEAEALGQEAKFIPDDRVDEFIDIGARVFDGEVIRGFETQRLRKEPRT